MSADDDRFDAQADEVILSCLNLSNPRSFFLYAGAGSGKTRSLVEAVKAVCRDQGRRLSLGGHKIGVITYTKAARDEISQRLEFDERVEVSTIHAFAWSLIDGFNADIRRWLAAELLSEIAVLEKAQAKGRVGSKVGAERARSINSKLRRHAGLEAITHFVYSPVGDNQTRDSLSHSEVVAITATFLQSKPTLQKLLVARFPFLLIDESQDTSRAIMDALLEVEAAHRGVFCLGLIGDTMQRIYADGQKRLAETIPEPWARPRKRMNHRCPTRVIELINKVRCGVDSEEQVPRSDACTGTVRLFVADEAAINKTTVEAAVARRMASITGDPEWNAGTRAIKTLALEHVMSARRFGFEAFFGPLHAVEGTRTSLLQGTGAGIGLFTREILPLVQALRSADHFAVAVLLKKASPLLEHKVLEDAGSKQVEILRNAKAACDSLLKLVSAPVPPTARAVLCHIAQTCLFTIPDVLSPFSAASKTVGVESDVGEGADSDTKDELSGWSAALEAPFDQITKYDRYIQGLSGFDTHQGVKGREFPRVMVVVSDEEARGFMFNYDKLFGAKEKSKTDLEHEAAGEETTVDRTRRLFYVTCSRAEKSLAVVYYAANPVSARDSTIKQGWFAPEEIELI